MTERRSGSELTPELVLIWAMSDNGIIGKDGTLPWHLPADLARFKALTRGKTVLMGRKTWESLPLQPLPGRQNIVISRQDQYSAEGALVVDTIENGLALATGPTVFCIGGEQLYRSLLPLADRLEVTFIDAVVDGDLMFPEFDWSVFSLVGQTIRQRDETNQYTCRFRTYIRKG